MPYAWVEPDLYYSYKDVDVYHTYRGDDKDAGAHYYLYTLDVHCGDDSCSSVRCYDLGGHCIMVFDVRELPSYNKIVARTHDQWVRKAIRQAVDQKVLTKKGVMMKPGLKTKRK
jgi:hypothetical protein